MSGPNLHRTQMSVRWCLSMLGWSQSRLLMYTSLVGVTISLPSLLRRLGFLNTSTRKLNHQNKSRTRFTVYYSNVKSLRPNITGVELYLPDVKPDLLFLTETGHCAGTCNPVYIKDGFPCDRLTKWRPWSLVYALPHDTFPEYHFHFHSVSFSVWRNCNVDTIDNILTGYPSASFHIWRSLNIHPTECLV